MDSAGVGEYEFLAAAIEPDTLVGQALLRYAVWDVTNATHRDTLTWIITASPAIGISSIADEAMRFFNDDNGVNISSNQDKITGIVILDNSGKKVLQSNTDAYNTRISTEQLAAGIYYMQVSSANGKTFTQKILLGVQ
jgi:hypothetical protein